MDRLFTICYLPVCLLLLGVVIKFNNLPARPRILTSFALFTAIMLTLPLVRVRYACRNLDHSSICAVSFRRIEPFYTI